MASSPPIGLLVLGLKLVVGVFFVLVIARVLPPVALWLIPILYVGMAIWGMIAGAPKVTLLCAMTLPIFILAYFAPGPVRNAIQKAIHAEPR